MPPMIKGRLTHFDQGYLHGWVIDTSAIERRLTVELLHQGLELGSATADQPVPDLVNRHIGDGCYGFAIPLPGRLLNGLRHRFSVRVQGSATVFHDACHIELPRWTIGRLEGVSAGTVFGWVPDLGGDAVLELWLDDQPASSGSPSLLRKGIRHAGQTAPARGFAFDIPDAFTTAWQAGKTPTLHLVHRASGLSVGGTPTAVAADRTWGVVDGVWHDAVTGWACRADGQPPMLQLHMDGQTVTQASPAFWRPDLQRVGLLQTRQGFSLPLPAPWRDGQEHLLEVAPPGGEPLRGGRSRQRLLPAAPEHLPEDIPLPAAPAPVSHPAPRDSVVDIIIPVYRGLDETLACVRSVLMCGDTAPHRIVIINDASPEPALTLALRELASEHPRILLLENENNKGFVGSVNRGMRQHPGSHVILLNSDTLVPRGDWITRLLRALHSERNVATVTPFSNRATICSLPRCNHNNDLLPGHTVDSTDALCHLANAGETAELPTAIGFCMVIHRAALDAAGEFNEQAWDRGYCEENDFCLRASALGWRHLAACDVFVQHHGEVSFAGDRGELLRRNARLLDRMYPHYKPAVSTFLKEDPLWRARARVMLPLLQVQAHQPVLHILHTWGGGTEHHVRDLCRRQAEQGQASLILRAKANGWMELADPGEQWPVSAPRQINMTEWAQWLQPLGISRVHFHHTMGLHPDIWTLPALLGVPHEVTLHDFFALCPRVTLLNQNNRFCDQPPLTSCETCAQAAELPPHVEPAFSEAGGTVANWRQRNAQGLLTAQRVTAPSADTAARYQRAFPDLVVQVQAHEEPSWHFQPVPACGPDEVLRVAVIGAIGPHKGHDLLLQVARQVRDRRAPIHIYVVGPTCDNDAYLDCPQITILGRYESSHLQDLLRRLRCHAALFLSNWPETYSYTLSEAWRAGLWPVVTGLGAPAERVRAMGVGSLLSTAPTADEVIERLLSLRVGQSESEPVNVPV